MDKVPLIDAAELSTRPDIRGIVGRGGNGTVRLCSHSEHGKLAVKCFLVAGAQATLEDKQKKVLTEAEILHNIAHKNIMKFYGICLWANSLGIVTEYLPGGNLDELLSNESVENLPWLLRLRFAVELSEAICFLHNYRPLKALVHGDIKPQNVLMTETLTVKLADFGSVNIAARTGASTLAIKLKDNKQITPYYTAPEFLKDCNIKRLPEMDVFSYGIVLYEVVTRMRVFEYTALPQAQVLQLIRDIEQRPDQRPLQELENKLQPVDRDIFGILVNTMKTSWSQSPSDRPKIITVRDNLRAKLTDYGGTNTEVVDQLVAEVVSNFSLPTNLDSNCTATLNEFSYPFETIVSQRESSRMQIKDLQQQIPSKIESLRQFLDQNQTAKAVSISEQLVAVPTTNFSGDIDPVLRDVIGVVLIFCEKEIYIPAIEMLRWTIGLCDSYKLLAVKLNKLVTCGDFIHKVAFSMNRSGHKGDLEEHALPLLKLLHNQVKLVQIVDIKHKTKTECWCLSYIGWSYLYIGKYSMSVESCESAITIMRFVFNEEAKLHWVFAASMLVRAAANRRLENNALAVEQYKETIAMCEAATDVSEDTKNEGVSIAESWLQYAKGRLALSQNIVDEEVISETVAEH